MFSVRCTIAAVLVLLIGWLPSAVEVSAITAAPAPTADPAGSGRLMLVLDSSGSMAQPAAGGGTKIAAAKAALRTVIDDLPADAAVGLRVYGSRVFSRSMPGACTDSRRVVDVGTGNRDALRAALSGYRPYGETPIGYALQQAGKDLGGEGRRSIVLVSDGEPTCAPDPCQVAKQLAAGGVDLRIDVVGLDVSHKAAGALRCIAENGHGRYVDAGSADELRDALATLATRAVRPYETSGQAVSGGADAASAPTIGAGSYTDTLGGPGTKTGVRTYLVQPAMTGSTITVTADIMTPRFADKTSAQRRDDAFKLQLAGPDGRDCDVDTRVPVSSVQLPLVVGTVGNEDCPGDEGPLQVTVTRSEGGQSFTTPLELQVTEVPPVAGVKGLPPAANEPVPWHSPTGGTPRRVTGGSSFAGATPLSPGSYAGTIVPNEIQLFKVSLDWGQQLAATMTIPTPTGRLVDQLPGFGSPFTLRLYGPTRRDAKAYADGDALAHADTSSLYPSQGGQVGGTTAPVRYRNSEDVSGAVEAASTAGDYTIAVSLVDDGARTSYEVPFTLRVGVTGTPSGAPTFVTASADPSASASAEATPTDPNATAEPTETASPSPATDAEGTDAAPPTHSGHNATLAAIGAAVVIAVLGGGYAWSQRRKGSAGSN